MINGNTKSKIAMKTSVKSKLFKKKNKNIKPSIVSNKPPRKLCFRDRRVDASIMNNGIRAAAYWKMLPFILMHMDKDTIRYIKDAISDNNIGGFLKDLFMTSPHKIFK